MKRDLKFALRIFAVLLLTLTTSCETTEDEAANVATATDSATGNTIIAYSNEGLSSTAYFGEVFTGMDSWLLQFACDDFHLVLFLSSTQSGSYSQGIPSGTYFVIEEGNTSNDEFNFIYNTTDFSYYIYNNKTYGFEAEVVDGYYDSGIEITNYGSGKYKVLLDLISTNGTLVNSEFTFTADLVEDMSSSASSVSTKSSSFNVANIDMESLVIAPYKVR